MYHGKRILAALIFSLIALTGCTLSAPKPAPQKPPAVTLRLGVLGTDPVMDALVSAFEAGNPGIRFEKVAIQNGTFQELSALIKDNKIDVLSGYSASLLAPTLVEPLDSYLQKDRVDTNPLGNYDDLLIGGHLYDLPYALSPFVLVYNQDIFSKAGASPPAGPMTWEEFRDLAKKLTSGQGQDRIYGFHPAVLGYSLEIFVQQHSTRSDWWNDLQAVHDGYQFFAGMIFQDESCPPAPGVDEFGRPIMSPDAGFTASRAAMSIGQVHNVEQVTASSIKTGTALLPVPAGGQPLGLVRPISLSIAATTPNMDAAWQFVRFATGPEGAATVARAGSMPAYRTPETMQVWKDTLPPDMAALQPLATMPLKWQRDSGPDAAAIEKVRVIGVDALEGKMSWEDAFQRFKQANPKAH
jgi:multiple sugar transport system substrate-binding protein